MSGASTAALLPAEAVRATRLREVAARALDGALAGCTAEDFVACFDGDLAAAHGDTLRQVYLQAQAALRENALVRGRSPDRACVHGPRRRRARPRAAAARRRPPSTTAATNARRRHPPRRPALCAARV